MGDYGLSFLLGASLLIFFIIFAFLIVMYILTALGLKAIADRKNIKNSWLAWIPIANLYLLGLIVKEKSKIPYIEWILSGTMLFLILFGGLLGSLGTLLNIALYVVLIMTYFELFRMFTKNYILFTILGAIFPFLLPFFVFSIRNNEEIVQ